MGRCAVTSGSGNRGNASRQRAITLGQSWPLSYLVTPSTYLRCEKRFEPIGARGGVRCGILPVCGELARGEPACVTACECAGLRDGNKNQSQGTF
eukprot:1586825-Pyramimonas_sp.AAC.1